MELRVNVRIVVRRFIAGFAAMSTTPIFWGVRIRFADAGNTLHLRRGD